VGVQVAVSAGDISRNQRWRPTNALPTGDGFLLRQVADSLIRSARWFRVG
jgi:hypothetical protein